MLYYHSTLKEANESPDLFILFTKEKKLVLESGFELKAWPTWSATAGTLPKKSCTVHILARPNRETPFDPSTRCKSLLLSYENANSELATLSKLLDLIKSQNTFPIYFSRSKKIFSLKEWKTLSIYLEKQLKKQLENQA